MNTGGKLRIKQGSRLASSLAEQMKLERAYAASLSRCALIARSIHYSSVRKRYAVRTEHASGSKLGSSVARSLSPKRGWLVAREHAIVQ